LFCVWRFGLPSCFVFDGSASQASCDYRVLTPSPRWPRQFFVWVGLRSQIEIWSSKIPELVPARFATRSRANSTTALSSYGGWSLTTPFACSEPLPTLAPPLPLTLTLAPSSSPTPSPQLSTNTSLRLSDTASRVR